MTSFINLFDATVVSLITQYDAIVLKYPMGDLQINKSINLLYGTRSPVFYWIDAANPISPMYAINSRLFVAGIVPIHLRSKHKSL